MKLQADARRRFMPNRMPEKKQGNVVGQYNTYIERIDDVVDALCNEITRLENENMQLSWDVLHIGSLINSLVNEIRTLCN